MCVQDGGRALEEAMCYNTSVTQLDVRLTGADEQSTSFILQALLANEGLDEQKNAEKCEMEGNIDKNIADLLENMTAQKWKSWFPLKAYEGRNMKLNLIFKSEDV